MLLQKNSKPFDYATLSTVPLTQFNDPDIAFVVGIIHPKYKALCVTKAGGFYASKQTPERLCVNLEHAWERYVIYTHSAVHAKWVNLMAITPAVVKKELARFQGPMRVATCGKRSFWSARPYNVHGLWFFTPACQHIVLHTTYIQFTTQAHGETIVWRADPETPSRLPVTPAGLKVLHHFVDQKAAVVQAYAVQEISELLHDQQLAVAGYDFVRSVRRYPIPANLFETDISFIASTLLGEHGLKGTNTRVDHLVAWAADQKKNEN